MSRAFFAALLVAAASFTVPVAAEDPLRFKTAKDLYASARYDEALTVLNGLRTAEGVDRKSIEQYRSLCLLALGRPSEAETAIAAAVAADPLYRPSDDASPRVRALFSEVRRRMLPEIVTARYAAAKATFDRQEWPEAERQFQMVLALIDDPDIFGKLKDLRLLTAGFLELSTRAAAPPPEPATAEPPPPAPVTAAPPAKNAPAGSARPATLSPESATPGKIFGPDDEGVVPPVTVRQEIPSVPAGAIVTARPRGLLEIVIDERGRVVGMAIRGSIHPTYDAQLLVAARDWKYKPATMRGEPVRYRKLIQVSVKR